MPKGIRAVTCHADSRASTCAGKPLKTIAQTAAPTPGGCVMTLASIVTAGLLAIAIDATARAVVRVMTATVTATLGGLDHAPGHETFRRHDGRPLVQI